MQQTAATGIPIFYGTQIFSIELDSVRFFVPYLYFESAGSSYFLTKMFPRSLIFWRKFTEICAFINFMFPNRSCFPVTLYCYLSQLVYKIF